MEKSALSDGSKSAMFKSAQKFKGVQESPKGKKVTSTSTRTSPPPQSIPTQTYEEVPMDISPKSPRLTRASCNKHMAMRRSQSMRIPSSARKGSSEWSLHRSSNRLSFTTDSQSLPNSREASPLPFDFEETYYEKERNYQKDKKQRVSQLSHSIMDLRKPELYMR